MEIQIVNLLPPEIPYQVTKMKKQMKTSVIYYDVLGNDCQTECDLYILIVGNQFSQMKEWSRKNLIEKEKTVLFTSSPVEGVHCWCMPRAFEKEFDPEKMMMMLSCILNDNPQAILNQSYDLTVLKMKKEEACVQYEERLKKYVRSKQKTSIHLFIKEKTRKLLSEDEMTMKMTQHWIKGIDSEVECLIIKRKS